jgi:hypothetical protein
MSRRGLIPAANHLILQTTGGRTGSQKRKSRSSSSSNITGRPFPAADDDVDTVRQKVSKLEGGNDETFQQSIVSACLNPLATDNSEAQGVAGTTEALITTTSTTADKGDKGKAIFHFVAPYN